MGDKTNPGSGMMTPKQFAAQEWLERHNQANATSKVDIVILCSLLDDPQTQGLARQYLEQWRRESLSINGINEIVKDGGDCAIPYLIQLVK